MSFFLRLALISSFAATLSAQSMGALISVERVAEPPDRQTLAGAYYGAEALNSGQHELGMQELHDALNDPVAMPYAISMVAVEHLRAGLLDTAIGEL